jgi:hypothetical protein
MFPSRDRRLGSRVAGGGARRCRRAWGAGLLCLASLLSAPPARAVPIDDPHVGGIGFSGPTTGDLAAVYWNPAALGLMHGAQLTFAGTGALSSTTVARAPIDPATGLPGGTMAFPATQATDRRHPFIWPPGPGAFAGISYDVGGDRFTIAFATYMPFVEQSTYQLPAAATALPTRYQQISTDLRNLELVPALAVRFAGDFRLGVATRFVLSTGRLSFDEPACGSNCGAREDPSTDTRYDVGSGLGLESAKFAVALGGGLYYRQRAWEFGLSFSSRPFGGAVGGAAVIGGNQTQVTRPGGSPVTCMSDPTTGHGCVYADMVYKLPYMVIGAVAWHPRPGIELMAMTRILSFPANDVIDIRLTGATLAADGLPQHIVLYRGYGTVVDTRLRVSKWLREWARVGVGFRFETSGLAADAVSPAAVDGPKIEPTAMIQLRVLKHLWLNAGYGFTYMFPVTVTNSVFDPGAAARCATAGGDLGTADCRTQLAGQARPTAAGTYDHHQQDFSLSVTAQF